MKNQRYRKLILKMMKKYKMTTPEVAAMSNLSITTVVNFLEERTYSPHHNTIESLLEGVGHAFNVVDLNAEHARKIVGGD